MRLPAALLSMAVLVALAAVPLAAAQPPTFSQAYQVRGAMGDIPTTSAVEPSNAWNLEQRFSMTLANGSTQSITFRIPPGAALVNASCTCGASASQSGRDVTFSTAGASPGNAQFTVLSTQPRSMAIAFDLQRPVSAGDGVVILYVPNGSSADTPLAGQSPGSSTDGTAQIESYQSDSLPQPFWVSIHPTTSGAVSQPSGGSSAGSNLWIAALVGGLVLGAILWAVLVGKGVVQTKSRRQVVATAAHVEAAAAEPAPVLEGRKRALMAALKEVEVARMNNEMPPEVYDVVKADLKKQTVTVMRALETAGSDAKA